MNGTINFGIIGAGRWGEAHADVYTTHPSAALVAVSDPDTARAERIAGRYGAEKVFSDYEEMVRDPAVDAVAVVTPDFAHRAPIVAAAQAGKAVITEKPIATTWEDAQAISQAVRASGVPFMVDFHNRWSPPIAIARDDISKGTLGEVISAYYRLNDTLSVPTQMLSWAAGSSILWFLGSHTVDTLRYLFQDEVARVYSVTRSGVLRKLGIDVPDIYQCILEFRSGIIATIENHWIIPNSHPMLNDIKINILGSKGMLNMDLTNNQMMERYLEDKSDHPDCLVKPQIHGKNMGFAYESIRSFVDCLAAGRTPLVGLEDGLNTTRVILAIMESASARQPVEVSY